MPTPPSATPEDRFYNPARINAWFAVSSVLVLASTAAVVLADHYDRQWKGFQESFHRLEKERAEKAAALRAAPPAPTAEAAAIRDRLLYAGGTGSGAPTLEDAAFDAAVLEAGGEPEFAAGAALAAAAYEREAVAVRTPELRTEEARLVDARQKAEDDRFKAEREQRGLQALVDEHKFRLDHARARGHAHEAGEAEALWKETVGREAEAHDRMDRAAKEKSDRNDDLKRLLAPVARLEERARRLWDASGVSAAERKMRGWVAREIRDAPLLDFVAPDVRIEQKVFPELTVDYNFAVAPRVDRCMTCHTGIDKVRVDPVTRAVTPVYTAENTPDPVFRTHSRPELFVSSVSKHSVDRVGCTVCHDGLGWGLSFAEAYHTPDDAKQEKEWEETYHWHRGESWTSPMLPLRHIEASCAKCHRDPEHFAPQDRFAKEVPAAPKWNRGLEIVRSRGCFGCHKIDGFAVPGLDRWLAEIEDPAAKEAALATAARKPGPSLLRIASKWTSQEAMWKWIWAPREFRPTTPMPHFFGQPNNSGTDPLTGVDYDLRTRTEVWGLMAYLWDSSEKAEIPPAPAGGDPANGKRLFGEKTVGCVACHATKDFPNPEEGGKPNDFAPDLSAVGSKVGADWIHAWIRDPSALWHGTRMPNLRLTGAEAADLTAYLAGLRDPAWEAKAPPPGNEAAVRDLALEAARATARAGEPSPEEKVEKASLRERLRMVGKRAVTKYSCFGCHEIRDFGTMDRIGTELGGKEAWGSKDVDRLDFGHMEDPKAVETYAAWRTDLIAERPEGGKALPHRKPEWARLKLLNPRVFDAGLTKQPHEKLLMPNFGFSEEDADAVVTFLLSLQKGEIPPSKRPVRGPAEVQAERMRWIAGQYNCAGCHTLKRFGIGLPDGSLELHALGGDIRPWIGVDNFGNDYRDHWPPTLGGEGGVRREPRRDEEGRAMGDPVLVRAVGEGSKVRADWLFRFLRDPGQTNLRPWLSVRMPTFPFTEAELNGLVHGFAADDGVPFPFEFEKTAALSPAEKDEAMAIFLEIKCQQCHPTPGQPPPSGFAPDLVFTRDRLRPDWVRLWLDNPDALQPRTKMPANWRPPPGKVAVPNGIRRSYFGDDPFLQMRRVADFVFDLGAAQEAGKR